MISKANVKNIYPLSPMQEGMLFHALHDAGDAYFEQLSYRIRGNIDPDKFRAAWEELVRRHDVLRTIFLHRDVPRPLQIVLKQWRVDFFHVDLRKLALKEAEAKIVSLKAEDRATPFDLSRDPLTRVRVITLADDEAEVIWSHHHIILDGWSTGILQGELLEIYESLKLGRRHHLSEPAPFSEYITWIGKQDQGASYRFWREYLGGFSQPSGLPRFPRREPVSVGRRNFTFRLDGKTSGLLTTLAAANGVTLSVLLQVLWGILLCRLNGVEDAVFAATVSGRPDELRGIEGMVGIFINAVPVRIRLNGRATFPELLKAHQAETLAASKHHWCSLADIQAETPLKQALLDHILIFENFPLDERLTAGGRADERGFDVITSEIRENTNYPFELSIIPRNEIEFKMGYDASVYDHAQMERVAWSLKHLIDTVIENQHALLVGLSILSAREKEVILKEFNRPQGDKACETVADVFEGRVAEHPDRMALVFESVQLTYRELNEAANRVANHLIERCEAGPDQVVGILMDRSERLMAGLWGIIKSGAAYLPLDPAFPAARIRFMLEDSGCCVLLTERRYRNKVTGLRPDAVIIEMDEPPGARTTDPPRRTGPEDLLYLIYTSGSTGVPKGVMLEQRNVTSFNRNMSKVFGLAPGDTLLALTTITFDISVLELICPLMSGMTVVLASDAIANAPVRAAALLGQRNINVLQITPSRLKLMLEDAETSTLGGLKALLIGGEPLPGQLFERLKTLPTVNLFNVYGPTETTIWSTAKRLNHADLTIGTPLVDEEVLVLDPDSRQILPIGVLGEICIGGQGLARGYWNRPDLTQDRFPPHPVRCGERMYRTGDLGRFLPNGDIQCGGRMDHQIKVRGYRIELGEIEQHLLTIPGVKEAVAHVVEIEGLNEIVAYLVPEGEKVPSPPACRARLAESLPDYMLPTYYVTLDQVPLTPNGKTDRQSLPRPMGGAARTGIGKLYAPPRTKTEVALALIWQRVLGVERVGVHDNFFDLGGHSIKAIRIVSAIAKELGREVPLSLIFEKPMLAALAAALAETPASEAAMLPLPPQPWYEASPQQRRLWVLQHMAPESAAYNMPVALKLEGVVNVDILEKSVIALTGRHEVLRTLFREQDGELVQVILPEWGEQLKITDLCNQEAPWEKALKLAKQQAGTPFNLSKSHPFKAFFYRTGAEEGLLLLLMHHISGDGWSWDILLHDLSEIYNRFAEGRSARGIPSTVQYKEWAHYQNRALAAGDWERARRYWHEVLAGDNTPLLLPIDHPRPVIRCDNGDSLLVSLPGELVARLEELGRSRGATLFMVLLTLLDVLLYRMSGQEEITVGTPVAGRPIQQLERIVGFFVNTLALRNRVQAPQPFIQLLDQVRQSVLAGYEHQLYPFDRLVSELSIPRDTGHAPLFDVMAVMQEKGEQIRSLSNLMVTPVTLTTGGGRFDLVFNFYQDDEGLSLELEYDADLFQRETAERIAGRFRKLAASAAAAPEAAIAALDLLPEDEKAALAACSAGAVLPWPQEKSMADLFRERAKRYAQAVAVVASDRTLTYAELDLLSERVAGQLQGRYALQPEEVVGVMTGRNTSLPIALLAILKGGGVYLPLDPDQPHDRICHMISDSKLKTLLIDEETESQIGRFALQVRMIKVTNLLQDESVKLQNQPSSSSPAYVIYTSGSTGLPKGVLVEHGGFVNMILDQIRTFGITPDDRCLSLFSFSFDGAMSEIFLALHSGARLVIARREQTLDQEQFIRLLEETGTTVATLTPLYLNALRTNGAQLDPLRVIITAGEAAIAADVVHYAVRKKVFNAYGPTEASVCSAMHPVDAKRAYHGAIPIGVPIANSELLLLDDQRQLVPFGVAGEICVAGPGLARGYLNQPELTASVFVPHPFKEGRRLYRTGDRGRRLVDGAVAFLERVDDQVKVRGFRIECGEVERALLRYPDVKGAFVTAKGDRASRELVAFLLAHNHLDMGGLKAHLTSLIPSYMIPTRFVIRESFPLNANGKVDRKQLMSTSLEQEATVREGDAPATPMEFRLAVIWEQVLGRHVVSRNDSFFTIGGHSIAAMRVVAAIREELGLHIPLPALFRHDSLSKLATECERMAAFAEKYEEDYHLLLHQGSEAQLFAFPPLNGYPIAYRLLAELLDNISFHGFTFIESDDRLSRYAGLINELQPDGPLTLLGHSSGGNLAFAVARELEGQGRIVADLILLDSWKRLHSIPVDELLGERVEDYLPDPTLFGDLAELTKESPYVREIAFGKMRSYLGYVESQATEGIIRAAIHLLCADEKVSMEGLSQEWCVHTETMYKVYDACGSHLDMLKKPWVDKNASIIRTLLQRRGVDTGN